MKIVHVALIAAVGLSSALVAGADPAPTEIVEISAPIFPNVEMLYTQEGANFPVDMDGESSLADSSALTYDFLLNECAANYPSITLSADGDPPLTSSQLAANYQAIAQCSYEQYTAKPYWIPQLVSDVDICGNQLGADWALLSEADIASFSESDFQFLHDTLTDVTPATSSWGTFYFSLQVFTRATDGTIKMGDLNPGVTSRMTALNLSRDQMKQHLEAGYALRCIRRTTVTQ